MIKLTLVLVIFFDSTSFAKYVEVYRGEKVTFYQWFDDEVGGNDKFSAEPHFLDGKERSANSHGSKEGNEKESEKLERITNETLTSLQKEADQLNADLDKNFNQLGTIEVSQHENVENLEYEIFSGVQNSDLYLGQGSITNSSLDLIQLEKQDFLSDKKTELNAIRNQLRSVRPQAPQQANAKVAGLHSLAISDKSYVSGDISKGDFYLEMAKQLASVAADFISATSVAKDVYGLIVGKDLFTGEQLSTFDRTLSGAFAIATITASFYTGGAAAPFVTAAIKQIRSITKAEEHVLRVTRALARIGLHGSHNTVLALKGIGKKYAMIGRSMEVVRDMRDKLKAEGLVVEVFDGPMISKFAQSEWDALKIEFGGNIPGDRIKQTSMFKENEKWVKQKIADGYHILDTGDVTGKAASVFYDMETYWIELLKGISQ